MKKAFRIILIALLLVLGLVIYTNWVIHNCAQGRTTSAIEKVNKNKVGLLLGTSQFRKGGGKNLYFKYRIQAAVKLFKNNKIDFILVSGDNAHLNYNEPRDLKKALLKHGIPLEKIILDYAGFRTLDSVIRAKEIFGQENIIIISQKFQNERAIYLAEKNGLHAFGFNAKDPGDNLKIYIREQLARTKAYFDILFGVQPKFLGNPVKIE